MLQKIWKIVIFHLSLYNKTWDSPTLINLTNLTRGVRYCQVPNLFLVSGSGAEKAPIMNYCSFGRCVFLFFNIFLIAYCEYRRRRNPKTARGKARSRQTREEAYQERDAERK